MVKKCEKATDKTRWGDGRREDVEEKRENLAMDGKML